MTTGPADLEARSTTLPAQPEQEASSRTAAATTAFRGRFATEADYRQYMRGLALRPRSRKVETHAMVAFLRGTSIASARRTRALEPFPDLVQAVKSKKMTQAAALREAATRKLPYMEQVFEREVLAPDRAARVKVERAVRVIKALGAGKIDLDEISDELLWRLEPRPTPEQLAGYLTLIDALKTVRDGKPPEFDPSILKGPHRSR
jgi:hypothetical protein